MKKLSALLLALLLALSLALPSAFAEAAEPVEIVVFHTNDVHARVNPDPGMGYAMAGGYIAAEREAGRNVLVLDAGDTFHGLAIATAVQGESIADILNAVGYDAMAPGNHDFNYGTQRLQELKDMLNFPLLCCNVVGKQDGKPVFQPYTIKEFGAVKVGIIGVDNPEIAHSIASKCIEDVTFQDGVEAVTAAVEEIVDETDAIIVVSHWGTSGVERTSEALATIPGVDLVVDGHSHEAFPIGKPVEGGATIVSTGEYLENLGKVTLTVSESGVTVQAGLIPAPQMYPDSGVEQVIEQINADQDELLSEVVAQTSVRLVGERELVRTSETNLGDVIGDAILAATGADVALINGGAIRQTLEVGEITRGQALAVMPFGNYVVTKSILGSDLKTMLENGVRFYPEASGSFLQVAGLSFSFDPAKEAGSRVVEVSVAGEPLEEDKSYLVAINDYMAGGDDGYEVLANYPIATEFGGLDEMLFSYLTSQADLPAEPQGRIRVVSE